MGQYGLSIYGESYYGIIGAAYGTYTSNIINPPKADFTYLSELKFLIDSTDKVSTYNFDESSVFTYDANWTVNGLYEQNSTVGAVANIFAVCRELSITYKGDAANYTINIFNSSSNTYEFLSSGTLGAQVSDTTVTLPLNSYGCYQVVVTVPSGTFYLKNAIANVSAVEVYFRSSGTSAGVSSASFAKLPVVSETKSVSYGIPMVETRYDTSGLTGNKYYQYKVIMYCSDDALDTVINKINILSVADLLYTEKGFYTIDVDMTTMPTGFNSYDKLDWTSNEPAGTDLKITTQSSPNGTAYTPISPRYVKGYTHQLRLQNDYTSGYFLTKLLDTDWMQKVAIVNINTLISEEYTSTYKGSNGLPTGFVTYSILQIPKDGSKTQESVQYLYTRDNLASYNVIIKPNCDLYVKITLNKPTNYITPYVNFADIKLNCNYIESKSLEDKSVSAIEGVKNLCSLYSLGFIKPASATDIKYEISYINENSNYKLYFASSGETIKSPIVILPRASDDNIMAYSLEDISCSNRSVKLNFTGETDPLDNTILKASAELYIKNSLMDIALQAGSKYLYRVEVGEFIKTKIGDRYSVAVVPGSAVSNTSISFFDHIISNDNYTYHSTINTGYSDDDKIELSTIFNEDLEEIPWTSAQYKSSDIAINQYGELEAMTIDVTGDELPIISERVFCNTNMVSSHSDDFLSWNYGPYKTMIVPGSVMKSPKDGEGIKVDDTTVKITNINCSYETVLDNKILITRGSMTDIDGKVTNVDKVPYSFVTSITDLKGMETLNGIDYPLISYTYGTDYTFNLDTSNTYIESINWIGTKPDVNSNYQITFNTYMPKTLSISFECDTNEDYIEIDKWESSIKQPITGQCEFGSDYVLENLSTIYSTNGTASWSDLAIVEERFRKLSSDPDNWNALNDEYYQDFRNSLKFVVYKRTNPYVDVYISSDNLIGTLGGFNPSKQWMLLSNSGYYYLGKDEYYKYCNQAVEDVNDNIPIMTNCEYVAGLDNNCAVIVRDSVKNYSLNGDMSYTQLGTGSYIDCNNDYIKNAVDNVHSIKIEPIGSGDTLSTNSYVYLDKIIVCNGYNADTNEIGYTAMEENDVLITYSGTWTEDLDGGNSSSRAVYSSDPTCSMTLSFNGTSIQVYGRKGSDCGFAKVTIDDAETAIINLYSETNEYCSNIFEKYFSKLY